MAATNKDAIKTLTTHYIDGAFVESHGREVMDMIKPTNGKVIARVALADEEDTRRAAYGISHQWLHRPRKRLRPVLGHTGRSARSASIGGSHRRACAGRAAGRRHRSL